MDDFADPDARPDDGPAAPTPRAGRAMRRRLLERVADADERLHTVDAGDGEWQPFLDGIRIKVLREADGVMSYLLRFEPGARLPPHRHRHDEECMVLDGLLRVGSRLQIGPGGYHLAPRGALHATVSTDTGATVFLRGATPEPNDELS